MKKGKTMMTATRKVIDVTWEKLSGKHISLGTLALCVVAYGMMFAWMDENFISEAQGAQISINVEANHALIIDFKDEYRIKNALDSVRALKYQRDNLEEKELRDGPSALLTARKRENKADMDIATEYKNCVMLPINIRPKCHFLRE